MFRSLGPLTSLTDLDLQFVIRRSRNIELQARGVKSRVLGIEPLRVLMLLKGQNIGQDDLHDRGVIGSRRDSISGIRGREREGSIVPHFTFHNHTRFTVLELQDAVVQRSPIAKDDFSRNLHQASVTAVASQRECNHQGYQSRVGPSNRQAL